MPVKAIEALKGLFKATLKVQLIKQCCGGVGCAVLKPIKSLDFRSQPL